MADHGTLVNAAGVHECKQILQAGTGDAGKVITPSSSTSGAGELRNLVLEEIDTSGRTPWTGWGHYSDGIYTSSNKLAVADSVTHTVTIDGSAGTVEQLPDNSGSLWNSSTNKITPVNENDAYIIRFQFKCDTNATDAYVDMGIDVGGTLGVIIQETKPILKGGAVENRVSVTWPVYTAATFLANGGTLFVIPSDAVNFWDFSVMVTKVHNGGA